MSRLSPSGSLVAQLNPFPGINSFPSNSTVYQFINTLFSTDQAEGAYFLPFATKLLSLDVWIIGAGADAVNHTWNAEVDGSLVPGLSVTLPGDRTGHLEAFPTGDVELPAGSILNLQMVTGIVAGARPEVRTFINFAERSNRNRIAFAGPVA